MAAKFVFFLLSALLLTQCTFGKYVPRTMTQDSSEESDERDSLKTKSSSTTDSYEDLSERTKLLVFVIKEFSKLADANLRSSKKMLEDVIAEMTTAKREAQNPTLLTARIEELSSMVKKLEKLNPRITEENMQKFDILIQLDNLLDQFKTTAEKKLNTEDLLIENSLKKHGLESLEREFKEKFLAFSEKFYRAADKYWDSMSPQQQSQQKEFSDWLNKFKQETDTERKIELFGKIFHMEE